MYRIAKGNGVNHGEKNKAIKAGFILRKENPDKTKKYFRELPGNRRTYIRTKYVVGLFGV
jgi:hypothetical protein